MEANSGGRVDAGSLPWRAAKLISRTGTSKCHRSTLPLSLRTHSLLPLESLAMSSPFALPKPPFSVAKLLGGLVVEICIALALYGVTTAQSYVYMLNSKKDSAVLKAMVAAVWILETAHSAFLLREIYYYTIIGFGDYNLISRIDWYVGVILITEILVVAIVEGYYIHRIWGFSERNWALSGGLSLVLFTRVGFHMASVVYSYIEPTWAELQRAFGSNLCIQVSNGLAASIDGLLAICLVYYLIRGQNDIAASGGILRWAMAYTVNSGAVMMAVSIAIAITYSTIHGSLVFAGLMTIVSKLYANSFLGTLNAREFMGDKSSTNTQNASQSYDMPKFRVSATNQSATQPRRLEIFQHTTTDIGHTDGSRTLDETKEIDIIKSDSDSTGKAEITPHD
ncbi:hypothetical protein K474DRAFT_1656498 [Panus rudis PR-1116 ss-1]|nr:hypothetical protein K474DRAFT_1656498 [Panus rudis PR-1116 ss-1]